MGVTLIGAAKPCDYCASAAALLFCRADAAFMCLTCDAEIHGGGASHGRVWVCDACERAPAAVTCKADAAALCAACDGDIHSANPLSRRHDRAPVVPFYGDAAESLLIKSTECGKLPVCPAQDDDVYNSINPDPWISTDPVVSATNLVTLDSPNIKPECFFSDSDQFLDFDSYQVIGSQPFTDSLVPVQAQLENRFEIDFARSNINFYNNGYTTPSLSHSVSSSSLDVGIVPDGSALSETSYPFARTMSSIDLTTNQASQPVGMDREARVLRYKEKRKNRKFEKTIRYASRKAYAETRPRIKGRFAKRTDSEPDLYWMFSSDGHDFVADARYGVVPSF